LESNSFAEMVQRNTDGTHSLKADVFATADCKFELKNLDGTAAGFTTSGSTVADDPATDCDESLLLVRQPDGTIQYRQRNTVDPPGINGQAVYNGTPNVDRIAGGNDNDTFWGGLGNDRLEGQGAGADAVVGVGGDDWIQGGCGQDLLIGDHSSFFFDDPGLVAPGNEVFVGQIGENDYDAEGGDDLMSQNSAIDRNAGAAGFDW